MRCFETACTDVAAARTSQVLRLLVRLAEASPSPDWVEVCQCLMFLDDAPRVAGILGRLVEGSEDDALVAYQVGGHEGGRDEGGAGFERWQLPDPNRRSTRWASSPAPHASRIPSSQSVKFWRATPSQHTAPPPPPYPPGRV